MTSSERPNILDLDPDQVTKRLIAMGIEPYRAGQVLGWIYQKGIYDFERMSNLSYELRARLRRAFRLRMPEIVERRRSHDDRSVKALLRLEDGDTVECVTMPVQDRLTVCVSSQVGCKFHCAFCASGQAGFFRNLKMSEILAQLLVARDLSKPRRLTHVVFMGIGEPFDNYTELLRTVRTLNSPQTLGIGARRITISTCGVVPKIRALAEEGLQVELSVSLHGPNNAVRGAVMPVNKAFPVEELIAACHLYVKKTHRAITFEYILIDGVNSAEREARELAKLLEGLTCKVNLIPYNPIQEFPHAPPSYRKIVTFQKILQSQGVKTTVRFSKGRDIQAACGQLRSMHERGGAR